MASKKFGTKHPNLWIFLEKMINLIKDQELDLGRAKRGLRVRRICSRSQRQKNLRIMEIQEDLITGKISLQQFLKMFNNEHEHQQYGMQKLIYEDSNNNDDINLEHFVELQKKNAAVGETSSRRVNVLAHSRGRDRGRGRTRNSISLQRSSHISSKMNNPTMHNLEQLNTSPPNPEVYDQRSNSTSRENRVHISRENISHDIHDRAISQDISVLNLSDEDIYCIPPDDYGNIFPDETEKEDIPYYPVQPISNIRTSNCCSVCLVKRADHIFIPCGHLCCCMDCILQLQSKRCPICNVDYNSYLKVITP